MMASDADAVHDWFLQMFGGEDIPARGKGRFIPSCMATSGSTSRSLRRVVPAPSRFRSIDHIGFRVPSLQTFGEALEASGYTPYLVRPNPPGSDLMFFEGPEGIHFEITENVVP